MSSLKERQPRQVKKTSVNEYSEEEPSEEETQVEKLKQEI